MRKQWKKYLVVVDVIRDKYIPQTVGKSCWFQVALDMSF